MSDRLPQVIDLDAPIFAISVAARLAGMHPQTLRGYDRLGLVSPQRARGRGRRYSRRDIERLRLVQHLSQEEGINLPGIRRILALQAALDDAQRQLTVLDAALRRAEGRYRIFTATANGRVGLRGSEPRRELMRYDAGLSA